MNTIDPLVYAKRLTAVGVPVQQAQVHAEFIREVLAAIAIDRLEAKIDRTKAELEAKIDRSIAELRIALMEEIQKSKWSCVRWMFGIAVSVGTIQGAAIVMAMRWLA